MENIKFINAGAGSGKTYRLTEILADWVEKGNNANQVLLTTFTKKAAAEIRERAQAKLLDNNKFVQANKLQEAFMGTVHSVGYQFIKKYWYLLGISPELTEISEKERDFFFSQSIANVPSNNELFEFNDICYQFNFQKYEDDFYKFNSEQWKDDIINIINEALANNINLISDNSSLECSLKKWRALFNEKIEEIDVLKKVEEIEEVLTNNPKTSNAYKSFVSDELISLKSKKNESNLRLLLDLDKAIIKIKKYVYGGAGAKSNEPLIRENLSDIDVTKTEIFKNFGERYIKMIFKTASESLGSYSVFKQEKGLIDYTDMEVYFLNLLEEEIVKNEIRETIKLVMVDEFQDSNPIQLSIFMKLSELTEQSYWVGDPKQAIYGFRGADPVLIDQIVKEFTKQNENGLSIDILKMSWRSVPELVNLSNQIFEERMLEQSSDIYLETIDQIHGPDKNDEESDVKARFNNWVNHREIHPLKKKDAIGLLPARNTSEELNGSPIKIWNFLNYGANGALKAASVSSYFQKLAQKTASIIEDGKKGSFKVIDKESGESRDIVGSDICFLVSSNKKVSDLSQEFQKLGYPVNAIVEGLTDTVEYRILQNIITLFIDKNNALSSTELAYLTGEHTSVSGLLEKRINLLTSLLKQQQDDEQFNFYEALNEWLKDSDHKKSIEALKKQSAYLSVYYTLQKITNQFNIFQKLLNFKNADLRQANILKLCELAKEYETYCINMNLGSGLIGFLNFVESNKEYNVQAANTNKNAVNIMTYHKSKGLEWPMVILSDLSKNPLDKFHKNEIFSTKIINNSELNISNPLQNRSIEFSFWPFGTSTSVNETLKEKIENSPGYLEKETNKYNEFSRLMYVGITRARDYIVFATNQYKNATWLENVVPNWELEKSLKAINFITTEKITSNFFKLEQPCHVDYERIMPDTEFKVEYDAATINYFKKQLPVSQNNPCLLNPSNAKPLKECKVSLIKELHNRLTISTNDSTELGNTLHQLLYIKDRSYFAEQVLESETFVDLGIDKNQFIKNVKIFNEFMEANFNISAQHPELSMEIELQDQLVKGEADLVLETENGLVLIDYKSYAGTDDVTNPNCEYYAGKYSGQLDLYAQMLEKTLEPQKVIKKLIYYVVQGKIVELN